MRCSAPGREHVTNKTGSSEGGAVPEKYYVVANNDHVRVKKILIFETSSSSRGNKSRKYVIYYDCFIRGLVIYSNNTVITLVVYIL